MSSVFEVLEDTTAAAGAGGAAAAGEAEVAGESLKNGVYTGAAYRDHEKLCRLVELEGRQHTSRSPTGKGNEDGSDESGALSIDQCLFQFSHEHFTKVYRGKSTG
ncbi:hypothetical protein ZWY2020_034497 [Hordeum vulgare]|nr:hypothetical protein ZWY2020_034497 [Hordeum vulgare]